MSDLIKLLETLGSNATLTNQQAVVEHIKSAGLEQELTDALIKNDHNAIEQLVKNLPKIKCFAIVPAEDDEDKESDNEKDHTENVLKISISG